MTKPNRFINLKVVTLIVANGFAIWHFNTNGGVILEALWIYWLQSVIIGFINIARIIIIPLKAPPSLILANPGLANTDSTAKSLIRYAAAGFFSIHYGMYHFIYAVFLATFSTSGITVSGFGNDASTADMLFTGIIDIRWVMVSSLLFGAHHLITFLIERGQLKLNPEEAPDVKEVMFRPYNRIIPMHMTIILGPIIALLLGSNQIFAIFMILKTIADLALFYRGSSHPGTINASKPAS